MELIFDFVFGYVVKERYSILKILKIFNPKFKIFPHEIFLLLI